jgi:hypothetical protein
MPQCWFESLPDPNARPLNFDEEVKKYRSRISSHKDPDCGEAKLPIWVRIIRAIWT